MDSVVVTGVSTGIGRETAATLLARGFRVFGSIRRREDAERLSTELGASFTALRFDVTDEAAIKRAAEVVTAALGTGTLAGLVNNAGIAVPGPLLELSVAELRRQFEVNLVGQLRVTQIFAPLLGVDPKRTGRKGRIVMVSSLSGRRAFPFNGFYSASKFALEGLSESLRRELMYFGVDVIVVAPGSVRTPIWDKGEADMRQFADSPLAPQLRSFRQMMLTYGRSGVEPQYVGTVIADALTARRPKARYEVSGTPLQNRLLAMLPKRAIDRMLARRLGLLPPR